MSIVLQGVTKHFGRQAVVSDVSLEVAEGEFFVLLGSSGSGKTTILNIIAGLLEAEQGHVLLAGRDVSRLPPQVRSVGYVFQDYALFQHMNVAQNIEFGLQVRRMPRAERGRRRDELLELVGLVGFGDRMPGQLSGGQQQRVALARALAIRPHVLLLDEPLGALDAKIRVELRRVLKRVQRSLGVATILVTHDQEEAFDLGDHIGVMSFGRLIEVGTPQQLYQKPQTEFVASFLGTANLLLGESKQGRVRIGEHDFPLTEEVDRLSPDGRIQILFRPEDIALASDREGLDCGMLGLGTVLETGFSGPTERLRLELQPMPGVRAISPPVPFGHAQIRVEANRPPEQTAAFPLRLGQQAWVGIRRLHVLPHPGLNFLLVLDGSEAEGKCVAYGGYLARMAHARTTLMGVGADEQALAAHLQDARKQIGSGMASVDARWDPGPPAQAVKRADDQSAYDLVILDRSRPDVLEVAAGILQLGGPHILLATDSPEKLERALICVQRGEPGKEDVLFAGRFLRHLGVEAAIVTAIEQDRSGEVEARWAERFVEDGLESLKLFGVHARSLVVQGPPAEMITSEIRSGGFGLVVIGAPLPGPVVQHELGGVAGELVAANPDCSFLIVRSTYLALAARGAGLGGSSL
jgi:sulfate transport system ATP-binding protein